MSHNYQPKLHGVGFQHFRTKGEYLLEREFYDFHSGAHRVLYAQAVTGKRFGRDYGVFFEDVAEGEYRGPRFIQLPSPPEVPPNEASPGIAGVFELKGCPDHLVVPDDRSWYYNEGDMRPHVLFQNARMRWWFGMGLDRFQEESRRLDKGEIDRITIQYAHPLQRLLKGDQMNFS